MALRLIRIKLFRLTTIDGSVLTNTEEYGHVETRNTFHVFVREDKVTSYKGTVKYDEDNETYSSVDDSVAISAYHYVLCQEKETESEETEGFVTKAYKEVLEGHNGISDGYYAVPGTYGNNTLTLKNY